MKIKITFIAEIDNDELLEAGVSLTDKAAIEEFYYNTGGDDAYYDHGESFEIIG